MIKPITNALDESEIRTNLNLRMETIHDTSIFIFETKNSEIVEGVSELPSELRKEGMVELLGQSYGPYLAIVSAGYYGDQESKGKLAKDSIVEKLSRTQFRFDLMANKGKLAKSYDITKYGIYYMAKLVKGIKGDDSEDGENEAAEE